MSIKALRLLSQRKRAQELSERCIKVRTRVKLGPCRNGADDVLPVGPKPTRLPRRKDRTPGPIPRSLSRALYGRM